MSGRPRRLRVFAVEDTSVQLIWGDLAAQEVRVRAGEQDLTVAHPGGPGVLDVDHLPPGAPCRIEVSGPGWRQHLTARTLTPPPGAELVRLATLSDMHVGMDYFGFRGKMREDPEPDELHTTRCTRAALTEAAAWGAQHLLIKGDVTFRGAVAQWDEFGALIAATGLPCEVLPGNHDVSPKREIEPDDALVRLGLTPLEGVRHIDLPGLRVILLDTTTSERHVGQLAQVEDEAIALAESASTGVLVAAHHHPMPLRVTHFWPPGIPSHRAGPFLRRLSRAQPDVLYTAGHTHRHRRVRRHGVEITEVGSPKDYPGTWGGYVVHEGGIRQVVRRVADPGCLPWLEYTRWAAWGAWGRWSPGRLEARSFTHPWVGRGPASSEQGQAVQERRHGLAGDRG